jgi:DNA-directed RNA polymerase subunit M
MEFCPKDGTLMLPGKTGKTAICPKCGTRAKVSAGAVLKEKVEKKKVELKRRPQEITETMPTVDAECPKCGSKKAYWWVTQTGSGLAGSEDQPDTEFFRCTRCRNTWRRTV